MNQSFVDERTTSRNRLLIESVDRQDHDVLRFIISELTKGSHIEETAGKANTVVRRFNSRAAVPDFPNPEWVKVSIFLNFLIPKLSASLEEVLSMRVLETTNSDRYREEVA